MADSAFAALDLLAALTCKQVACITRLRLDAALYEPAPLRSPGAKGRSRKKGQRCRSLSSILKDPTTIWQRVTVNWYGAGPRVIEICSQTAVWYHPGSPVLPIRWVLLRDPQGQFEPQALLCTNLNYDPAQIVQWFIKRWQVEVTFEEARAHLGVETQRQWSEKAIARSTPCLFGLFSIVTLLAAQIDHTKWLGVAATAWYKKATPTFSDTLAAVRRCIWASQGFFTSMPNTDIHKTNPNLYNAIQYALCQAA